MAYLAEIIRRHAGDPETGARARAIVSRPIDEVNVGSTATPAV